MSLIRPKPRLVVTMLHRNDRTNPQTIERHEYQCTFTRLIKGNPIPDVLHLQVVPSPQAGFEALEIDLDDLRELLKEIDEQPT